MVRRVLAALPLVLSVLPAGCSAQGEASVLPCSCSISRISDGDTFRCQDGRRVRLIGIDSPESRQQPFGGEARAALLQLLPLGSTVRLELDLAPTDRYGRTLAYVWAGSTLVNEAMVRKGWAILYTVPPNVKYIDRLRSAQNEARAIGAGLWSRHGFDCQPSDFRQRRCVNSP
jgi:micrococcal nuclease